MTVRTETSCDACLLVVYKLAISSGLQIRVGEMQITYSVEVDGERFYELLMRF